VIGERGTRLSGASAAHRHRARDSEGFAHPDLDEATSELDTQSEMHVQKRWRTDGRAHHFCHRASFADHPAR